MLLWEFSPTSWSASSFIKKISVLTIVTWLESNSFSSSPFQPSEFSKFCHSLCAFTVVHLCKKLFLFSCNLLNADEPSSAGTLTVYEIYISYVNVCSSSLSNNLLNFDIPKWLLLKKLPSGFCFLQVPWTAVFTVLSTQGELTPLPNFSTRMVIIIVIKV